MTTALRFIVILVLAAGLGFSFLHFKKQEALSPKTVHPVRGRAVEAVYATGEVEAVNRARISPQMTVLVREVLVDEGDGVRTGQILAHAEDEVEKARLDELKARLAYSEQELKRAHELQASGYGSRQREQSASSEQKALLASIAAQEKLLLRMDIKSPIDGMVLERNVDAGETKTPADAVFWVGQEKPLRILAEVDEEDIPRVRKGQEVLIKSDAFAGREITGRVAEIAPKGDPVNKNFRVKVSVNDDAPLLIGMTVEVNIITSVHENALLIPAAAIEDGKVTLLLPGNKRKEQPVRTGIVDENKAEILEGLSERDEILMKGSGK